MTDAPLWDDEIEPKPTTHAARPDSAEQDRVARRRLFTVGALGVVGAVGAGDHLLGGDPGSNSAAAISGATDSGSATDSARAISRRHVSKRRVLRRKTTSRSAAPSADSRDQSVAQQPGAAGGPANRDASLASTTDDAPLPPGRQYSGFAKAAAAATPVAGSIFKTKNAKAHLLRRATFGPRPADRRALKRMGIDRWLSAQLSPESLDDSAADRAISGFKLATADPQRIFNSIEQYHWDAMYDAGMGALGRQIFSERQLFEIVVDVMANHLHVPMPSEAWDTSPDYHQSVIRAHAFGSFEDMLLASMSHPAMLYYLNNNESSKESVNENLGRELLELHTVGLEGGYTEKDVRHSAYILSGRTLEFDPGRFVYRPEMHRTGKVRVLGFQRANSSAAGGMRVGNAYLRYLARHEATARNICTKLAIRFVTDDPPKDLIDRLSAIYLKSGTDLREVVRGIFLSSDFWNAVGMRSRRPLEDAVGAARVLDVQPTNPAATAEAVTGLYWAVRENGHAPHDWAPPNGYPDVTAAWLGAGDLIARWNLHRSLVGGWRDGLSYTAPEDLVSVKGRGSAGDWVDDLAKRLVGQRLKPRHRKALLAFAGVREGAPAKKAAERSRDLAALILDSAYFQLR